MGNLAIRIGQEIKKIRTDEVALLVNNATIDTDMVELLNDDLSNMSTLTPEQVTNFMGPVGDIGLDGVMGEVGYQEVGDIGLNGKTGEVGDNGLDGMLAIDKVSTSTSDTYTDNKSIYVSPSNVAYYKTALGWVEIGELYTGNSSLNNSISAGYDHTLFLLADGTCKAVGKNSNGQLGDGTTVDKSTPVSVLNISNCVSITSGYYHTLFLLSDGTCKSVGRNVYGQLGDGTTVDKSTPIVATYITGVSIVSPDTIDVTKLP